MIEFWPLIPIFEVSAVPDKGPHPLMGHCCLIEGALIVESSLTDEGSDIAREMAHFPGTCFLFVSEIRNRMLTNARVLGHFLFNEKLVHNL